MAFAKVKNMGIEEKKPLEERCEPGAIFCEVNQFYSSPCFAADVNKDYLGLPESGNHTSGIGTVQPQNDLQDKLTDMPPV